MTGCRSFNNSMCKKVLNPPEAGYHCIVVCCHCTECGRIETVISVIFLQVILSCWAQTLQSSQCCLYQQVAVSANSN